MAKRGRPAKVTKFSLLNAISRNLTVADTARDLGVDRHTVYDAAKRFGVNLSTALQRFPTPLTGTQASWPSMPPTKPESDETPFEPPQSIQAPSRQDRLEPYRGRSLGDAGTSRPDANSYEARYRRLKGY